MLARSAARPVLATLVVCLAVIQSPPSAQAPTAGPLVVAPAGGGNPQVFVIEGTTTRTIQAYDPNFIGGVNATLGDVNGDGTMDIITGAGPGGGPHVIVLNGTDLSYLASFFAYDPAFTGGVTVAAGDLDGDGRAEVITGAGRGGGPHVRAFRIEATPIEVASFYAYDPRFIGGVTVAAGDVDGDGVSEIITGAGPGGGPHVRVISGTTTPVEVASFFAYEPAFPGGVRVAAGD
ncbi:MAG TPA: VCBS repeat-containing protein, partial [Vicinamibacterales bacterium]|nr:VCBS repeat-containing protein [Vicinamibacterales bacterium]